MTIVKKWLPTFRLAVKLSVVEQLLLCVPAEAARMFITTIHIVCHCEGALPCFILLVVVVATDGDDLLIPGFAGLVPALGAMHPCLVKVVRPLLRLDNVLCLEHVLCMQVLPETSPGCDARINGR